MGLFTRKKPEETSWVCKGCSQDVAIKNIGAVMKEGQITIPPSGNCEDIVTTNDEVLCSKCTMQIVGSKIIAKAQEEKRPLTITELRSLEEQLRSDNLIEAYRKIKNRENLPDNSARYDSMTFDGEGKSFIRFTCPNCSKETMVFIRGASIKTIEEQLVYYTRMHEKVPMTCPSCAHNFTLYK